jgi:Flp pilus assembly protein TadB
MHMSLFAYTDAFFGLLCIFCFQGAAVYLLLGYGSCGEVVKIIDRARHANWQAQYEDRQQQKKVQKQLEAALAVMPTSSAAGIVEAEQQGATLTSPNTALQIGRQGEHGNCMASN